MNLAEKIKFNPEPIEQIEDCLMNLQVIVRAYCPGNIADFGAMLKVSDVLTELSKNIESPFFHNVCLALNTYVKHMTQALCHDVKPVEGSIALLKSALSYLKKNEPFPFEYSDVLQSLNHADSENKMDVIPSPQNEEEIIPKVIEHEKIPEDEMEILIDFVLESEENLNLIEVDLIDLEQDPSSAELINDIFRPFHSIKGVSGFLSLDKINRLAHSAENLLDGARNGEFEINRSAADAILDTVDSLKVLISGVKLSTQTGFRQSDDDVDVDALTSRMQKLQSDLSISSTDTPNPLGEILCKEDAGKPKNVEKEIETKKYQSPKNATATQVKVSTQKLDDLVDYAGELVIAQSMLRQKTEGDASLSQNVAQLGQIVTNMQNIAMSMRMIPIKSTFTKMIRLVRDLSKKSGKEISLKLMGEDTEIDRNVVDTLYEPMVHMIRNSIDHGIESRQERLEKGKSTNGNIILKAYHKGGQIIIEIEDDGKGLDKERILKKADDAGIISGNDHLTDSQIYDLILQPGFSTAEKITDISGRGVGMDVVKAGIEKFRGHLNIDSTKDKGTRFTIGFPLTLAIIDGMLVKVDAEKYIIPTTAIQRAFKPDREDYFTVKGKGEMVRERGNLIPLIRMNRFFKNHDHAEKITGEGLVVVVESQGEKKALLIDELLGKDEYVIKSLGSNMENVKGISGGAILADGQVGLILDIPGLFEINF